MPKRSPPVRRVERRVQLLKIARQLVAQQGISALTMMALSEFAGVAKPVVYSHFNNAEEVAIELLDEHFSQAIEAVSAHVARAKTLEEYVTLLVDASFDFENSSDTPVRKITNGFSGGDAVNLAFLRHEETHLTHWQALLRQCGAPADVIEVGAYALSGMISNTVYTYALQPQQRKARETLKTLLLTTMETLAPGARERATPLPPIRTLMKQENAEAGTDSPAKAALPRAKRARAAIGKTKVKAKSLGPAKRLVSLT